MTETAEGISGRKWSVSTEGGQTRVMEGTRCICVVEDHAVLHLLVTAPQLWGEANDVLLQSRKDDGEPSSLFARLRAVVAKAVNKTSWAAVAQAG